MTVGDEVQQAKEAARAELSRAISAYSAIVARERSDESRDHDCGEPDCGHRTDYGQDAFVLGWAVTLEYSSVGLEREVMSGRIHIVAESQAFATSVGLFTIAARDF